MVMQNNLKFRTWNVLDKTFSYWEIYSEKVTFGTSYPEQYTGLNDKESKEIYVGDYIFSVDDLEFYEVTFHKGMFVIKSFDDDKSIAYTPLYEYVEDSVVYSNIHESTLEELNKKLD
jgi:hypothetical protein